MNDAKKLAADIRQQVRMALLTRGWSQHDLAKAMNVGQPAVSMLLTRGTFSLQSLVALADALDLELKISFD